MNELAFFYAPWSGASSGGTSPLLTAFHQYSSWECFLSLLNFLGSFPWIPYLLSFLSPTLPSLSRYHTIPKSPIPEPDWTQPPVSASVNLSSVSCPSSYPFDMLPRFIPLLRELDVVLAFSERHLQLELFETLQLLRFIQFPHNLTRMSLR